MLKDCTILTDKETEKLKYDLDHAIEWLIKASNKDCDGTSPTAVCKDIAGELKDIRKRFD